MSAAPLHGQAVGGELLAQADGHGVLQVRAGALDDGVELAALLGQGLGQAVGGGGDLAAQRQGRQVHGRREGVVGRLAHVDVVVGMDGLVRAEGLAEGLVGAVRQDLVGVHVEGGAGAGLKNIDDPLVKQAVVVNNLHAGVLEGVGEGGVEFAQVAVGQGAGQFHQDVGPDEFGVAADVRDGEVLDGPLGLGAPVGARGDADFAQGIALDAELIAGHGGISCKNASTLQLVRWRGQTFPRNMRLRRRFCLSC